jgi:hypothetical protein
VAVYAWPKSVAHFVCLTRNGFAEIIEAAPEFGIGTFDALDLSRNRRPNTHVIVADYVNGGQKYWNVDIKEKASKYS